VGERTKVRGVFLQNPLIPTFSPRGEGETQKLNGYGTPHLLRGGSFLEG